MSKWEPMETAPKDGSAVLVYEPNAGVNRMIFMDGKWRECVSFCELRNKPTHWMPLPPAPDKA